MENARRLALIVFVVSLVAPAVAYAQGEISGVARDTSGAVLPGVTVEAASPVLIEKVRSVATDATGRFRITNLRPGPYTVTFTLPGFASVRREGVQLTGAFVAQIDAELRVGALEETVTVTGETPTVDLQSVTRESVLNADLLDALPTSRNYSSLSRLIPGAVATTGAAVTDVGGTQLAATGGAVTIHGSRPVDQRITLNGVVTMTLQAGGHLGGQTLDLGSAQEVTVDQSALSADLPTGGVRINFIPKDGGNRFTNATFFTFSHESLQGDNFTERVRNLGFRTPDALKKNWDLSPAVGGPIQRDKLWFWYSFRWNRVENYAPIFENKNAWDATKWLYEEDPTQRAILKGRAYNNSLRVTWQASPRHKIAGTYKADTWCECPSPPTGVSAGTISSEAHRDMRFPRLRQEHLEWTSPVTSRLMLEAVGMHLFERWGGMHLQERGSLTDPARQAVYPSLISVTEQSNGLIYRAYSNPPTQTGNNNTIVPNYFYRAAVSYVTGAHAIKAGFNRAHGYLDATFYQFQPTSYVFNNGVPNSIVMRATPRRTVSNQDNDLGFYIQDRWTTNRLTVNGAVRFDYFKTSFPEQQVGPGSLVPTRNLTFPAQDNLNWKDITYRSGASFDLFGNGKTAVKVTFNKYLLGQTLNGLGQDPNPVNTLVNLTTRAWNDANRNFVPDCNLLDPLKNGECERMANPNFGKSVPGATFDPDLLTGWGHRMRNWEFSAGVQHELLPRVSVDVGYFRRIWGNFQVTDNLALGPEDFNYFSITAPAHAQLPDGGGFTLEGLRNVKPDKFSVPASNHNSLSDKYGKQIEHWNGVDVTVTARLPNRLQFQGGISTGKTTEDNCEIVAKLPELTLDRPLQFCHRETPFLTNVKAYGMYTIPRIDVQVAGTLQSIPGPEIPANYLVTNAVARPSLGRDLAGGVRNITVNILRPGSKYGERLNQLDLRFGKILRAGRSRTIVSLDLYNALNNDTVRTLNSSFGAWLTPTSVLPARFAKVSLEVDF